MRTLNAKQKKILDEWLEDEIEKERNGMETRLNIHNVIDCLDYDVYEKLRDLNDFETINQEIERYIGDKLI